MPAPRLTKPTRHLYKMRLEYTHHAYELFPTVSMRCDIEWTDGTTACVALFEVPDMDLGELPGETRDLVDAFLWGEEAKQVIGVVQRLDRSRQARRAQQEALREVE